MSILGLLFGMHVAMVSYSDIKSGTLVDVRTKAEFARGHHSHAVNIPLDQLQASLPKIKAMKQPLYLCCQSGRRSGNAKRLLTSQGIPCTNVGGWADVPEK